MDAPQDQFTKLALVGSAALLAYVFLKKGSWNKSDREYVKKSKRRRKK